MNQLSLFICTNHPDDVYLYSFLLFGFCALLWHWKGPRLEGYTRHSVPLWGPWMGEEQQRFLLQEQYQEHQDFHQQNKRHLRQRRQRQQLEEWEQREQWRQQNVEAVDRLAVFESRLCVNCLALFLHPPTISTVNLHSKSIGILRKMAKRGCPFCAFVLRKVYRCVPKDVPIGFKVSKGQGQCWTLTAELGDCHMDTGIEFKQLNLALTPYDERMMVLRPEGTREWPLQRSNQSGVSRQLARHWHLRCKEEHQMCRVRQSPAGRKWLPTRLLSFMPSQDTKRSGIVCLVNSASLPPDTEYVALSHCWGSVQPLRLLASTEAELRSGIPSSRLPKTFREAITVSQWFEYGFIWIDSLCIIQDSTADWQNESQQMKNVYSMAALTIVAANAKDSRDGLFVKRETHGVIPPIVPCKWDHNQSHFCVIDVSLAMEEVDFSALAQRAWTVQERALSPRLLTFGKSQMFYQCCITDACESWPVHRVSLAGMQTKMEQLHTSRLAPKDLWFTVVETYSRSALTKQSDKFLALAGIAEAMEERMSDRYILGMWKSNLEIELLWSVHSCRGFLMPRPDPCLAPTWSWLSTSSEVWVKTQTKPQDVKKLFCCVVNVSVDLVDSAYPTGDVHPGSIIQVRGRLKPATWLPEHCAKHILTYEATYDGISNGSKNAGGYKGGIKTTHDAILAGADIEALNIFLLPIATIAGEDGKPDATEGLVLAVRDESAQIYVRVAHFEVTGDEQKYLFMERQQQRAIPQQSTDENSLGNIKMEDSMCLPIEDVWREIEEKDIVIM